LTRALTLEGLETQVRAGEHQRRNDGKGDTTYLKVSLEPERHTTRRRESREKSLGDKWQEQRPENTEREARAMFRRLEARSCVLKLEGLSNLSLRSQDVNVEGRSRRSSSDDAHRERVKRSSVGEMEIGTQNTSES
jgi:hypothetical protein